MKLILPTNGTRGDVQPYIALALGLKKAGHSVTLATHPCLRAQIEVQDAASPLPNERYTSNGQGATTWYIAQTIIQESYQ